MLNTKRKSYIKIHTLISIKKFNLDNFGIKDQSRFIRPTDVNHNQLNEYIAMHRKSTNCKMTVKFNCNQKTNNNLGYVNKKHTALFKQKLKKKFVTFCNGLLNLQKFYDFFDQIITYDKK